MGVAVVAATNVDGQCGASTSVRGRERSAHVAPSAVNPKKANPLEVGPMPPRGFVSKSARQRRRCLSHNYDTGASFLCSLADTDAAFALQVRERGCPRCRGVLDRADYPRKPRGDLGEARDRFERRLSFCCRREGCRRRATPPSVRFLGRKVYVAVVVVVASAWGRASSVAARGRALVAGVPARTVRRWLSWWSLVLARSAFWVEARGSFATPIDIERLPCSLLDRFGQSGHVAIERVLRLIAPVTTASVRTRISMLA